jgi:hypothetical protein
LPTIQSCRLGTCGKASATTRGGEVLDLGEAHKEQSEPLFLELIEVTIRRESYLVDAVIDADDAVAPSKWSVPQVLARGVADAYHPVQEQRDEAVTTSGLKLWNSRRNRIQLPGPRGEQAKTKLQ